MGVGGVVLRVPPRALAGSRRCSRGPPRAGSPPPPPPPAPPPAARRRARVPRGAGPRPAAGAGGGGGGGRGGRRGDGAAGGRGRADSTRRPPAPKAGALPGCATSRGGQFSPVGSVGGRADPACGRASA